jgi:hypothetical protein
MAVAILVVVASVGIVFILDPARKAQKVRDRSKP